MTTHHGGKIEHPEYQDCLDLMGFYEVYCSPTNGVVKGDISEWIVMACVFAIVAIVAAILKEANS